MNSILAGVNAVPGVIGSCIFDADDQCVALLLPPPYEPILLRLLIQEMRSALATLSYVDGADRWKELVLECDGGFVSFRSIGGHTLMVLAGADLNVAMLGVGASVAALKLEQQAGQGARSPEPSSTPAAAARPAAPMAAPRVEPLPKMVVESVITALARQIGPIARLFVEQEAAALASLDLAAAAKLRELVAALAGRVPDAQKRREFVAEVEDASRRR
jgi:hypothetical protein